jgi:hypothetical protein
MIRPRTAALAALSSVAFLIGLGSVPASAEEVAQPPVRINAGGSAGTFEGKAYLADTYALGGRKSWSADQVSGTTSSSLYQSRRIAPNGYSIPVQNGTYDVTLKTAETWFTTSGSRRFSVSAEGQPVLTNTDVFATVGHDRAYSVTTRVTVTDGRVDLGFTAIVNNPVVAAIEVIAVPTTTPVVVPADVTAPVTAVSGGPAQGSVQTSTSVSFALAADEASTFQCRLGGAAFASCPSAYSLTGLPLGVHTLQVRATDPAGNVDATPESRTWTVVPATPGAVKPEAWNTGVPAGTVLRRHDGNLTVTTAGTVIDSLDVHGADHRQGAGRDHPPHPWSGGPRPRAPP